MTINVYDQNGKVVKKLELNPTVFSVTTSEELIHTVLRRQEANRRRAVATVKGRSERRGGGRKPWRQKGTGRARTGSIRAAQWRKGGRIFGPSGLENYSINLPRKQRIKALLSVLSLKAADDQLVCLQRYQNDQIKTRDLAETLAKLPLGRSILIALPGRNEVIEKSAANLPNVKVILASYLNISDLLTHESLLVTPESLKKLETLWGDMFKPAAKKEAETKAVTEEPKTTTKKAVAVKKTAEKTTSSTKKTVATKKPATKAKTDNSTSTTKKTASSTKKTTATTKKAAPKTAAKKASTKKASTTSKKSTSSK